MIKNEYISFLANLFARMDFFKSSCLRMAVFYYEKEGEAMKLVDHLSQEQRQRLNKMRSKPTSKKKKKQEHLSRRDWEDIMGVHRDTYERRNGAVRRK